MDSRIWKVTAIGLGAALVAAIAVLTTLILTGLGDRPDTTNASQPRPAVTSTESPTAKSSIQSEPTTSAPSFPAPSSEVAASEPSSIVPPLPEPSEPVAAAPQPVHRCPNGYLNVRGGKVTVTPVQGDLYAVQFRGVLVNATSAEVVLTREDPPDVLALDSAGETITIVSRGKFAITRTDGTPVPDIFVLKAGQQIGFSLSEDARLIDRKVATWYDVPTIGSFFAEWNDAADYGCGSPLRPAP